MRELDLLAGSYFDLLWHFDPAAASAAGSVSSDGVLGRFDAESMRAHLAAFRATTVAIEELDIEALSDEVDRTALLDDVRATIVPAFHRRLLGYGAVPPGLAGWGMGIER